MNLNGVELNKDQLWNIVECALRSEAKRNDSEQGDAYAEVLYSVAAAMSRLDMNERSQHRQEFVDLLRLEG